MTGGRTIESTKAPVVVLPSQAFEPVAVIGLGCVLPDAPNVETFWQNLLDGRCSVREVPAGRWNPDVFWDPSRQSPDQSYSKIGSFVEGFQLDWRQYRIPPKLLRVMDASQQWAIDASAQALRDSGYDKKSFDRARVAVIFGNSGGGEIRVPNSLRVYFRHFRASLARQRLLSKLSEEEQRDLLREWEADATSILPELDEDSLPGELSNVIAGRVASTFNLTGKNLTVDAACAAGVAAIDVACQALQTRQCDMALAGASDHFQEVSLFVKFCRIGALSPNGSFPFDDRADGFVMGEGCGVTLLKRLADAERDNDPIHCVIRGIGSSSDGGGKAIMAPNPQGQAAAIQSALAISGILANEIDFIEAHGTGTVVGDTAELVALQRVFAGADAASPIAIGSVKGNVGHLKSAAGIASFLKAALALRHGILPASLGVRNPNPEFRRAGGRLRVQQAASTLPDVRRPRRGGISSFGFGGTNFHLILEEAPEAAASRIEGGLRLAASKFVEAATDDSGHLSAQRRVVLVSQLRSHLGLSSSVRIPLQQAESLATLCRFLSGALVRGRA